MNEELLTNLGLNKTQAKAYITLVRYGSLTPPELAKKTGETRTNAYTVLDRLVELGLAKKTEVNKKFVYRVENPVALERLVKQQRDDALERERLVKNSLPTLLNFFYTYSEQPGVRFFQGKDGIEEIYKDQLRTGKDITFIRTRADMAYFDFDNMSKIRSKFNANNIKRHGLTPDAPEVKKDWQKLDIDSGLTRTWYNEEDYTAPVEWSVYGNKVSAISFGQEALGMIIESPQISASMKQLFELAKIGLKSKSEYKNLPKKAAL